MFSSSFDLYLKDKKSANATMACPRRRRANSDSELTFFDSFDRHKSWPDLPSPPFLMTSSLHDDVDIDIMGTDSNDTHILGSTSTMDPSQMFINNSSPAHSFDFDASSLGHNDDIVDTKELVSLQSDNRLTSIIPPEMMNTFPIQDVTNCNRSDENQKPLKVEAAEKSKRKKRGKEVKAKEENKDKGAEEKKRKIQNIAAKPTVEDLMGRVTKMDRINQQWITMKTDKIELKKKGHTWRDGMWSNEEMSILRENVEKYCMKHKVIDLKEIIFSRPKEARRNFYRFVAKGLNRTLFAVYRKVIRMYDEKNYIGRYDSREVKQLEAFRELYDNDWNTIGFEMGRSANSVKDKARLLDTTKRKGRWDEEELEALSKSVRRLTNTKKGVSVTSKIPWITVAQDIKTRSEKQCRAKWLNYLNWVECGGKKWVKTDEIELIQRVSNTGCKEETEIDWEALAEGWSCVRSPAWLRVKWWNIKKNFKDYQTSTFQEVLQYLQTEYIDQLCRKLQLEEVEESEVQEENETRKTDEERFESSLEPLRITTQQPPLSCDRNLTSVNIVNAQSYPVTVQFQLNNNDSANGSCDYHLSSSDSTNTYILQVTNRDSGNTAFNLELSNSISSNATCNNQLTNGTSSNVCSTFQLTNENETSTPRNTVLNQLLQTQHND